MTDCKIYFKEVRACAIVPTYNNQGTVVQVLDRLFPYIDDIFVVNDGSTDETDSLLSKYADSITLISYKENQGKGFALRTGFERAKEQGFDYAITIDSDGQHYPEDLPLLAEAMEKNPGALIVGNRKLVQKNMAAKSSFANYFSNFWFMVQTWRYLPDTQTGYRVYPLQHLHGLKFLTSRYEAELELLVFSAWHGVKLVSTPVRVFYPSQEERVSHFRPFWDFLRISILNTVLCVLSVCYGWWAIIYHSAFAYRLRRGLITAWCLLFALISAILLPLPLVFIFKRFLPNTEQYKFRYHKILCSYFRFLLYHIPGVKIKIDNPNEETFTRPAIIISNHQSHLDLLSILSLSPRIVAMTNSWVWNFWAYKPVLQYLEYYPTTGGLENNETHVKDLLERGYSVLIFPEGTRSEKCNILKFHRGAFYLSEKTEADLLPVYLNGTGKVMPKKEFIIHSGTIAVSIGKRHPYDEPTMGENYREKTRSWHRYYENIQADAMFK